VINVLIGLIVILAIVLVFSYVPHRSPTHCRCGRVALVMGDTRRRAWCERCWLKKEGRL
jgi:hypothetical protein